MQFKKLSVCHTEINTILYSSVSAFPYDRCGKSVPTRIHKSSGSEGTGKAHDIYHVWSVIYEVRVDLRIALVRIATTISIQKNTFALQLAGPDNNHNEPASIRALHLRRPARNPEEATEQLTIAGNACRTTARLTRAGKRHCR